MKMTEAQVATFCLSLPGAREDYKWGGVRVFSIAGNKMFALQNLRGDVAHLFTPLTPAGIQMVVETLGFGPLGAVQAHHFFSRQNKLQLAPHEPALAVDS